MNEKTAKRMRKHYGFKPNAERKYRREGTTFISGPPRRNYQRAKSLLRRIKL